MKKYIDRKYVAKILLFMAHIAHLYWILTVLGNAGQWSFVKVMIQFAGLALSGGVLIYVSKRNA